jgi:DegV family protein with EDD domain
MQIVTDSGTDTSLTPEEMAELNIHIVPLSVTLDGKSYREGIDIEPGDFYDLLDASENMPVTSQPSAGDFAETYRKLAARGDPDILSIHMTSGLSGTFNSALAGGEMVPEANVTHFDTKTLSAAAGWQVKAAAQAIKAGWLKEQALELIKRIGDASESMYTLKELKYLINGGRISHMKGLIASVLNIKPMIGVEKIRGTYIQLGQARTFRHSVEGLVERMKTLHPSGSEIMVQVLHSFNPEGGEMLRELIEKTFKCTWLPMGPMSLVLGAHTGRSMVGVAFAPLETFADIPKYS